MQGSYSNQGWVPYGYPVDHTYAWHQVNTFQNVSSFYYYPVQQPLPGDSGIKELGSTTKATAHYKSSKEVGSSPYEESGSHSLASWRMGEQSLQSTHCKLEETSALYGLRTLEKDPEVSECHDIVPMDISPISSPVHIVSSGKMSPRPSNSPVEARASLPARNVKHILEKVAFRFVDPQKMPSSALDVLKKSAEVFAPMTLNRKDKKFDHKRKQVSSSPEWRECRRLNVHSPSKNGPSSQGGKVGGNSMPVHNAKGNGFQDFSRLPPNWLTPQPVKRQCGKDVNGKLVRKEDCKTLIVPESKVLNGKSTAKLVNESMITPPRDVKSEKGSVNTIRPLLIGLQSDLGHKRPSEKVVSGFIGPCIQPTSTRVNSVAEKDTKKATDNGVKVVGMKLENEKNRGSGKSMKVAMSGVKPRTDKTSVEVNDSLPRLHALGGAISAGGTPENLHGPGIDDISGGSSRSDTASSVGHSESATEYAVPEDISCTLLSSSDIAFSSSLGGCIMEKFELTLQLEKLLDGFVWGE